MKKRKQGRDRRTTELQNIMKIIDEKKEEEHVDKMHHIEVTSDSKNVY